MSEPASGHRAPRRRASWPMIAAAAVLLATLGIGAFAGYWYATGGRWLVVRTPSMATAAPVGTLLWLEPTTHPHVGELISFHPPGSSATYTHRVHAIAADGTITTKGDGNPVADPWRLTAADVTGRVAARWWMVGWLVRAGPLLLIGAAVLWVLVTRFTATRFKIPATTLGGAVLVTLAIWIYRPLLRAQLVVFEQVGAGAHPPARATYVSTGIFPVKVVAPDSPSIVLHNGQYGSVLTHAVDAHGRFHAGAVPHLSWWMWAVMIGVCFAPALWTVAVGVHPHRAAFRAPPAVAAG